MKKRLYLLLAVFALLSLMLTGCGGDGPPEEGLSPIENITVNPAPCVFPSTTIGEEGSVRSFTVKNVSSKTHKLLEVHLGEDGPFKRIDDIVLPLVMQSGVSATFQIEFSPKLFGNTWGGVWLEFEDKSANTHLQLRGDGHTKGNLPPTVDLGPDIEAALSDTVKLQPVIGHDGNPGGWDTLTFLWEYYSGPGTVHFTDRQAMNTRAAFTREGVYTLNLTVNDSEFKVSDRINITVGPSTSNLPPEVDTVYFVRNFIPDPLELSCTYFDDGLPADPGKLSFEWSRQEGPGEVDFADAGSPQTSAAFTTPGDYVLRITADDGGLQTSDTIEVEVHVQPIDAFTLDSEVVDNSIKLKISQTEMGRSYDGFRVQLNPVGLRMLKAEVPADSPFDPDGFDFIWSKFNGLTVEYTGSVDRANAPGPVIDLFLQPDVASSGTRTISTTEIQYFLGGRWFESESYHRWEGAQAKCPPYSSFNLHQLPDDTLALRAFRHLNGVMLLCEFGPCEEIDLRQGEIRVNFDADKLDVKRFHPNAYFLEGTQMDVVGESTLVINIDADRATWFDERYMLFAVEFTAKSGATGTVDFDSVSVGHEFAGGLIGVEEFAL